MKTLLTISSPLLYLASIALGVYALCELYVTATSYSAAFWNMPAATIGKILLLVFFQYALYIAVIYGLWIAGSKLRVKAAGYPSPEA